MKKNNKNKIGITNFKTGIALLFIIILFIIFLGISLLYTRFIKQLTYKNIYNNITELSEQTATQLSVNITNQKKFLDIMVESIDRGYFETIEDIFLRYTPDLNSYHFTRLVVLDRFGNGITSDGYKVKNYENIEEFFKQDTVYLSENRPSTVSNNQVNIYSKTFDFNGQKMVLFATINTEDYKDILSRRLFNGEGGTYLINNNGDVLIDSFGKITENNINLYDYLKKENNITNKKDLNKINNIRDDIKDNKVGTLDITFGSDVYFIHYEKLSVNNWYVVTVAPDSTIAKELTYFLSISLGLCFFINFIIIGAFIYIFVITERKNRKIYETAYIDPVTNLGNEIYFKEKAGEFLQETRKNKYVAIIDINKFKALNKLYEYEFSNKILKSLGEKLTEILPENNITCRLSRDIFAVAFTYNGHIEKLIERIFNGATVFDIEGVSITLNLSIGVYKIGNDFDINKVLDKAYMAHSKVKGLYSDNYYIFDDVLEKKYFNEQQIESNMKLALKNNEFKVVYQPKISTKDESLAGAEALVRWYKDEKIIPPNEFIPLFEKNKFIIKLDLYVFEQVCKDISSWKEKYEEVPIISVNLSKGHFADNHFIDEYVKITDKYGIDRSKIDLEITESAIIDEGIDILRILNYIKKKGFIISIDDFGTGYSSLNMIQDIKADIMKIDKSFLDKADLNSNKNIINYIVFIAKNLDMKIIVEGVETKNQVDFIKDLKCDMIQGYYYSKPISKEEFEEYFNKDN